MRVLSLFDGISCGMLALQRANIPVEAYEAFEIDKYAVTVSEKNYPEINHHGNVFDGDFTKFKGYDLLLGGSPFTYWSIAKQGRETSCDGEGFRLFSEYVRALHESECRYFLYENNFSIHQNIKDEITKALGVQPIVINSSLVSGQYRKRCYWTNIPNITQPADKGIMLQDVLENGVSWQDKSYCVTASYQDAAFNNTMERKQRTMVAIPVATVNGKSHTIPATYYKAGTNLFPIYKAEVSRQKIAVPIDENMQNDFNFHFCNPVRIGQIGKGGQGQRIYSVRGKSVTMTANGGGMGAKTGLYKIYLPDGDYVVRKLTPVEAERLQTLPDNYTAGVSNTQRYKCIGNGWTVDVIAHILGGLHNV